MKSITTLIILIFFSLTGKGQLIVDNGVFFTEKEKSELTERLLKLNEKNTIETLIYTTMELNGKSPLDYAIDLSYQYKYMFEVDGISNGIIILLSKNDRKLQILNGYGLEWILSDSVSQIIVNQMIPFFKKGEFFNGINKAIDLINENVIDIDWTVYKLKKLADSENGKIFKIQYSNKTGNTKYKYAIDSDPQFSDDFKINLTITGEDFDLYYSKHMNYLIAQILTSHEITIYFRLADFNNKKLELIGIE